MRVLGVSIAAIYNYLLIIINGSILLFIQCLYAYNRNNTTILHLKGSVQKGNTSLRNLSKVYKYYTYLLVIIQQ